MDKEFNISDVEDPLDAIEWAAWQVISKFSTDNVLSTDDFTFTAALWCYHSFANIYQSYLEGAMGQLLL
jgi:enolase